MSEPFSWKTAVDHANAEIDRLRKKNDDATLDPVQTAAIRGEIAALKRLIALPETAARKAKAAAQILAG